MDYSTYLAKLLDHYECDFNLEVIEYHQRLKEPYYIQQDKLYLDCTRQYNYQRLVEDFLLYHILSHLNIKTDRLELHELRDEDYLRFVEIESNPKINYLEASTTPKNHEEATKRFNQARKNTKGIYLNQELIGFIGINQDESRASHGLEIGYSLHENYWNKGYMSESIQALCDFLLQKSPCDLISARVLLDNPMSKRVLEKCKFECEGIRRQSLFHPYTQKITDTYVYSKTKG